MALINDTQVVGHDDSGNQLADGIRTYVWDADHRLLAIYYDAEPNRSTLFKYDGLGRRVGIISKNGTSVTEVRLLWCGDRICQARNGTDTVTRLYYPEGEVRGSALLYYSRDHLGSVRDVSTVHNGARIASFDYDPYGKTTRSTGRLSPDFRYAGMYYLQEADLYLTQYRVYDPRTARWLSRDPIAEDGGINLYGYVGGNPVNYTDPTGQIAQTLIPGAVIGVGVAAILCASNPDLCQKAIKGCFDGFNKMFSESGEYEEGGDNSFPERNLPRDSNGNPVPDPEAEGPYTQLGQKNGRNGKYNQGREFDGEGKPVRDIDFTDHGRPSTHPDNPHQHDFLPNPTGGTPMHGPARPLQK